MGLGLWRGLVGGFDALGVAGALDVRADGGEGDLGGGAGVLVGLAIDAGEGAEGARAELGDDAGFNGLDDALSLAFGDEQEGGEPAAPEFRSRGAEELNE